MAALTLIPAGQATAHDDELVLPCRTHDPDLWFSESPADLERAKQYCRGCPIRPACLAGALARREPWGVWGGDIVENGVVLPRKRGRGRPPRHLATAGTEPCRREQA